MKHNAMFGYDLKKKKQSRMCVWVDFKKYMKIQRYIMVFFLKNRCTMLCLGIVWKNMKMKRYINVVFF